MTQHSIVSWECRSMDRGTCCSRRCLEAEIRAYHRLRGVPEGVGGSVELAQVGRFV
jgi:hypothetical protein